jgi:hypothetical protein
MRNVDVDFDGDGVVDVAVNAHTCCVMSAAKHELENRSSVASCSSPLLQRHGFVADHVAVAVHDHD